MCLQGLMKFHHYLLKILRKRQSERWTDSPTDNMKTVYYPTNQFTGGIISLVCTLSPEPTGEFGGQFASENTVFITVSIATYFLI